MLTRLQGGYDFDLGQKWSSRTMKTTNLGKAEGLPTIEWSQVEEQVADLLTHDDPRLAEPLDVLADDPEHRRKPTRDERGRAVACGLMLVPDRRTHPQGEERRTRSALHGQCRHERLRRDGFGRSPARHRRDEGGRDRGVVGQERMACAARRLGDRHHRALQRADARTTAVVRLRSQTSYRDRSRYRRRDAGLDALAVLSRGGQVWAVPAMCVLKGINGV